MKRLAIVVVAGLLVLGGCSGADQGGFSNGGSGGGAANGAAAAGFAAGGAQDAASFRENVREGYVPQPNDLTYEGLFHDYYFDTGESATCQQLFCPAYSRAVTQDPLSNQTERYVTVGLNSNLTQADIERKRLNLVVVVDTSGSMSEAFDQYYYDSGERQELEENAPKIDAAREAMKTLSEKLTAEDRLGIVAFSSEARRLQSLQSVSEIDRSELHSQIDSISADGGTNLESGMLTAETMLKPHRDADPTKYENRIVYLTDAMPNTGAVSSGELGSVLSENAQEDVFTTFLGVGVDFNANLVEQITSTRGANYYSIRSPEQFKDRMGEGFRNMVTPLVFNLSLRLDTSEDRIKSVYGTPDENASTGQLMHVDTLFPSRTKDNRTEGGVILLELSDVEGTETFGVETTYETRDGTHHRSTQTIRVGEQEPPYYGSSGARKAVTLTRYGTLLRNWAAFERAQAAGEPRETPTGGIERTSLGQWEQQSVDLDVSPVYEERIEQFTTYVEDQQDARNWTRLDKDIEILERLTGEHSAGNESTARETTAAG